MIIKRTQNENDNTITKIKLTKRNTRKSFNPLTSPGEGVSVFTYPYLKCRASAQREIKRLIVKYIHEKK